eukprot:1679143-Prymnesium_polylepis.1
MSAARRSEGLGRSSRRLRVGATRAPSGHWEDSASGLCVSSPGTHQSRRTPFSPVSSRVLVTWRVSLADPMFDRATDAVLALPPGQAPCCDMPATCWPHVAGMRMAPPRLAFERAHNPARARQMGVLEDAARRRQH